MAPHTTTPSEPALAALVRDAVARATALRRGLPGRAVRSGAERAAPRGRAAARPRNGGGAMIRIALAAAAASLMLVSAATATAATSAVSSNWTGYAVSGTRTRP